MRMGIRTKFSSLPRTGRSFTQTSRRTSSGLRRISSGSLTRLLRKSERRKHVQLCKSQIEPQDSPNSPREDDVLPDNLADSLLQASEATISAINRGATRCIIELLIPELWDPTSGPVFSDEGDSFRFWKLSRRLLDNLQSHLPSTTIKALFPDTGLAAMLQNQWPDATFKIGSITSRTPISAEDEVVILAAPDPQSFSFVQDIMERLPDHSTLIMFNPRLASGDAGVGLNVRRIRDMLLTSFVTTYSLKPIGDIGSVFRRYPEQWKVFLEDETCPGRYKLIAEKPYRPTSDELDGIIREAQGFDKTEVNEQSSIADSVILPIRSLQRFMKSLL